MLKCGLKLDPGSVTIDIHRLPQNSNYRYTDTELQASASTELLNYI